MRWSWLDFAKDSATGAAIFGGLYAVIWWLTKPAARKGGGGLRLVNDSGKVVGEVLNVRPAEPAPTQPQATA